MAAHDGHRWALLLLIVIFPFPGPRGFNSAGYRDGITGEQHPLFLFAEMVRSRNRVRRDPEGIHQLLIRG
jgi:hypothetical protein